jgi:hypothetical protein
MIYSKLMTKKIKPPHKKPCPHCGEEYHSWKRVFLDDGIQLVELQDQFIAWCNKKGEFVITPKIVRE